jgi:MtN3 and saliva related transmembrane protein
VLLNKPHRIGFVSGLLTTVAYIPQVTKIWSMRPAPADAVSLPTFVILTTGILGWVIYGIKIKSGPVWLANGATLVLTVSIVAYKMLYG